jgi:hypothetical protein
VAEEDGRKALRHISCSSIDMGSLPALTMNMADDRARTMRKSS